MITQTPFFFGEPKVKLEDSDFSGHSGEESDSHIDCVWTAHTATENILSARVTLSVLKGIDAKPTHFLLCSLPSQRSVAANSIHVSQPVQMSEIEVAC